MGLLYVQFQGHNWKELLVRKSIRLISKINNNNLFSRLDATEENPNNLARLICHTNDKDDPNLVPKISMVEGKPRLILWAKRDIKADEELGYDYGDRDTDIPWLAGRERNIAASVENPKGPQKDIFEIDTDDSFNDGLDDKMMGDENDKRWLENMTEKNREEELTRRHDMRDDLKNQHRI